jgi:hypothetical protein
MSDLVERLRVMAKFQTVQSEFGPDEHIAWHAADRIEELETVFKTIAHTPVAKLAEENQRLKATIKEPEAEPTIVYHLAGHHWSSGEKNDKQ